MLTESFLQVESHGLCYGHMTMSTSCVGRSDKQELAGLGVAARVFTVRVDSKGPSTKVFRVRRKFTTKEDSVRPAAHEEVRNVTFSSQVQNQRIIIRKLNFISIPGS